MVSIVAGYRFVDLADPADVCARLHDRARAAGLRGTLLVAAEGLTATLAGEDRVYDEVFRSLGIHRADSVEEMLDVACVAVRGRRPAGPRLVLLSPSGGFAVQMTDHAVQNGLVLPPVAPALQERIRALVPNAMPANPVDLTGQILNELPRFGEVLDLLLDGDAYDAAALFVGMAGGAPTLADAWADALVDAAARHPAKALLLSIVTTPGHVRRYEAAGYAVFEDTCRMLRAHGALVRVAASTPAERPPLQPPDPAWAALDPRGCRNEADARRLVGELGIPVLADTVCADADAAVQAARRCGYPVAVKVLSADLPHKTEVGGVVLDVFDDDAVRAAVAAIRERVAAARPDARIEGFLVAPMAGDGIECLLGVRHDPTFGPVVVFGAGGVMAELLGDRALRLAPVDEAGALAMIGETRLVRLLRGWRNQPAADVAALAAAVAQLSRYAVTQAAAGCSIEINPLLVRRAGHGVVALDALVAAG
jgi:acyl-CoA synthetase (NDP forming)